MRHPSLHNAPFPALPGSHWLMHLWKLALPGSAVTGGIVPGGFVWQGVSHSRTHFCWLSHQEYPAEGLHPCASESFPTICGHGANLQFGPVLPTALPSGHIFASSVQAVVLFTGGFCCVQPRVKISIIDKTTNANFRKPPSEKSPLTFIKMKYYALHLKSSCFIFAEISRAFALQGGPCQLFC